MNDLVLEPNKKYAILPGNPKSYAIVTYITELYIAHGYVILSTDTHNPIPMSWTLDGKVHKSKSGVFNDYIIVKEYIEPSFIYLNINKHTNNKLYLYNYKNKLIESIDTADTINKVGRAKINLTLYTGVWET